MYGVFFYKRANTREFHENRSCDHYILDVTANEFQYVCCMFPRQPGRCLVWQFPTQCRTAVAIREFRKKKKHVQFLSCDRSTESCICLLCVPVIFCRQGHIHDPVLLSQDRNYTCYRLNGYLLFCPPPSAFRAHTC